MRGKVVFMQEKKIDADLIIFDLDGTLIDSSEDIAWAANKTLEFFGYSEMETDRIKEHIGWGIKPLLEKLMPNEGLVRIMEAREKFLEFYGSHLMVSTYLYPGVRETIKYLSLLDKKMAIVTNKPVRLTEMILKELGLTDCFRMVLGGDSLSNRKPHPEPVEKTVEALGAEPGRTVVVGDSPVDCEAGKAAGTSTIGVSYGFRGKEELLGAGCDLIIDRFPDLKDCLR